LPVGRVACYRRGITPMAASTDTTRFVLRRLHSLTGVLPIGLYLVAHIFLENSFVLAGPERFELLVRTIGLIPAPILLAAEVLLIWGPLLFHSVYGFVRVREGELDNPLRNDYLGAYLYTLQRATGVIAFFFVCWHVWTTRMQYYLFDEEITFAFMREIMTDQVSFVFFLVGVLAAVFHFTNGLWTFCITWGLTVGARAQRAARAASLLLFVAMYGTALAIMLAFRA
jgi:succinate dehydrogenase / fumarate reductase cytochrome b subunit